MSVRPRGCFSIGMRHSIALLLLLVLCPLKGGAQSPERLEILLPSEIAAGEPLPVSIRALTSTGLVASNWQSKVWLRGFSSNDAPPVISEIGVGVEMIEITNPGEFDLDVSDWELHVLGDDPERSEFPHALLRLPSNTIMPAQSVLTWSISGTTSGDSASFVTAESFNPSSGTRLVRIYDDTGNIVDEVHLQGGGEFSSLPLWREPGLRYFLTDLTYQRIGSANHFRNMDWRTDSPTLGAINPSLVLPWRPSRIWIPASPSVLPISNGVWSGSVTLPATVMPGYSSLRADDGNGVGGMSAPFHVSARPSLMLVASPGLQPAWEGGPQPSGSIAVSIPAIPSEDLPVTLFLSEPGEFAVPDQVIIPAGTNTVVFAVTNLDDALVDGNARISLTARAPDHADATVVLLNADNESGRLFVMVPSPLGEDRGFLAEPGRVILSEPAQHDVLVELTADDPLEVPDQIVIPAGRLSASFTLRIGDNPWVNPQSWEPAVRAVTTGWPIAEGGVRLIDDEDGAFTLNMPEPIVEGAPSVGQVRVNTPHAVDTVFTLSGNHPRLAVPANVTLVAGATNADFLIQAPDNDHYDPVVFPTITAEKDAGFTVSRQIQVVDDEVNISQLTVGWHAAAIYSGTAFPFVAHLVDDYGAPQRTNTMGQLELLVAPSLARLADHIGAISFENGTSSNSISISGEALDVQLALLPRRARFLSTRQNG